MPKPNLNSPAVRISTSYTNSCFASDFQFWPCHTLRADSLSLRGHLETFSKRSREDSRDDSGHVGVSMAQTRAARQSAFGSAIIASSHASEMYLLEKIMSSVTVLHAPSYAQVSQRTNGLLHVCVCVCVCVCVFVCVCVCAYVCVLPQTSNPYAPASSAASLILLIHSWTLGSLGPLR
jgi:hypothetical protein